MTTGMLQAASGMQTAAYTGMLGLRPLSNSGHNLLSYKTHHSSAIPKACVSSAADVLFNSCAIYLGREASVTEALLMAVTAVRELTLLPGETAICKETHSSQDGTAGNNTTQPEKERLLESLW